MPVPRDLTSYLRKVATFYPVVTVTGPRQSGKTTLCQLTFPRKPYVSLEPLDTRARASSDPRGFLASYPDGAIIDEAQNVPDLFSYLQAEVDTNPKPGRFILTGSQHFGLSARISESLAGRVGVLHLLPPSLDELQRFPNAPTDLFETLWSGSYPPIFDRKIPAARWLADYVTTYIQRDVRQTLNVTDLNAFTTFLRLCAGRTGQEINLSDLGGDAGVSHNTARAWISVLEASFICFRVPAWHRNFKKQLVKAPKLHFFDSGLACHLLGIREPRELVTHPHRGAIFESWVAAEIYKSRVHRGLTPNLSHLRQTRGAEIDLVVERPAEVTLVEAKSGQTIADDFFTGLREIEFRPPPAARRLIYGGDSAHKRSGVEVIPWKDIQKIKWGD